MKRQFTILAILMSFAVLPAKAAAPEINLRLKQIKLDVALEQYEKIETALCELRYPARAVDPSEKIEEAIQRLTQMSEELRREIDDLSDTLERMKAEMTKQ